MTQPTTKVRHGVANVLLTRIGLVIVLLLLSACGRYSDVQEVTLNGRLVDLEKGLEPHLVFEAPPHWRQEVDWAEVSGPDSSFKLQVKLDLKKTDAVQLTVQANNYESLSTRGHLNDKVVEFPPLELKKLRVPKTGTSRVKRETSLRRRIPQQSGAGKSESPPAAIDLLERHRSGGSLDRDSLKSDLPGD